MKKIIEACKKGNLEEVKILLAKSKAEASASDEFGITALMQACVNGHLKIAKLLIEEGARINDKDEDGETALIYACKSGYLDIVTMLIENGADVELKNNSYSEETPSGLADMRLSTEIQKSPLDIALKFRNIDIACKLVDVGCKVSEAIVDFAIDKEEIELLKSLIKRKEVSSYIVSTLVEKEKKETLKELQKELQKGLWDLGQNIDSSKTNKVLEGIVDFAIDKEEIELLKSLMKRKEVSSYIVSTLVEKEKKQTLKEVQKELWNLGQNIDSSKTNNNGKTLLYNAISKNNLEMAKILMTNNSGKLIDKVDKLSELMSASDVDKLLANSKKPVHKKIKSIKKEQERNLLIQVMIGTRTKNEINITR